MNDAYLALRKTLDAARVAVAGVVGVLTVLLASKDVLHLPVGVVGGITAVIALAGQWGIRTKTRPDAKTE